MNREPEESCSVATMASLCTLIVGSQCTNLTHLTNTGNSLLTGKFSCSEIIFCPLKIPYHAYILHGHGILSAHSSNKASKMLCSYQKQYWIHPNGSIQSVLVWVFIDMNITLVATTFDHKLRSRKMDWAPFNYNPWLLLRACAKKRFISCMA